MREIHTNDMVEMVAICVALAERGAAFTAKQSGGTWEIKIEGV